MPFLSPAISSVLDLDAQQADSSVAASFIRELLKFEGARVPGIDPQNRSADEQRASGEEEELEAFPDLFFRLTR